MWISCSPWFVLKRSKSGIAGLLAATRQCMHSMAYQLRSWDTNKVRGGAGVCRSNVQTLALLPTLQNCAITTHRRRCRRPTAVLRGITAEGSWRSRSYEMSRLDVMLCGRFIQVKVMGDKRMMWIKMPGLVGQTSGQVRWYSTIFGNDRQRCRTGT